MSAHLEKVLKHAQKKLILSSRRTPTDTLDLYRRFLKLEEHRLRLAHKAGEPGRDLVRKRSELFTVVLRHIFQMCIEDAARSRGEEIRNDMISLLAVGGFGRGELCPHSDIDILFLYSKQAAKPHGKFVEDVVEQVLYILWDVGLKVGPATRTLDEVIEHANDDMQTKTALLEARLLAGPEEIFDEFKRRFKRLCIQGKEQAYLNWRLEDQKRRHEKFGNTVFVQEPQIKNGCGGLRDYHNLFWVAQVKQEISTTAGLQEAGLLSLSDRKKLDQAYEFLLRVRNELHYQHKRASDQLTLKAQGILANAFKYQQKTIVRRIEALMRDYYQHSRNIFLISNLVARRMSGQGAPQNGHFWALLPHGARKTEKVDGFVIEGRELFPQNSGIFTEDPVRFIRVFQLMQQRDLNLSPELQTLITNRSQLIHHKLLWLDDVREILFDILTKKGKVGRILRAMHETGALGRFIPEFRPLTCLVQHEFYHRYTADEHTLVCIESLDLVLDAKEKPFSDYRPLLIRCEEPDILYLALVLHDVGKGLGGRNHNEVSAQLAARMARRSKIRGRRLRDLVFLVDNHMILSEFAQRRNLDDPDTIREFARIVEDEERLDMLMLLTFADVQGTSSGSTFADWKELLVWNLYRFTREMLRGEQEFLRKAATERESLLKRVREQVTKVVADDEFAAHFHLLPANYLTKTDEQLFRHHLEMVNEFFHQQVSVDADPLRPCIRWLDHANAGHSEVIVVSWNRDRLFSKIVGAFSLADLNILSANIFTRGDDVVVDTFRVCTPRGLEVSDKRDKQAFEKFLYQSLRGEDLDFSKALEEVQRKSKSNQLVEDAFPTMLRFDNEASPHFTLLYLQAPDRIGLLHSVSSCLNDLGIGIEYARINTEKGAALDTFYLHDESGEKILDEGRQNRILEALRQNLVSKRAS